MSSKTIDMDSVELSTNANRPLPRKDYWTIAAVWAWLNSPEGGNSGIKQRQVSGKTPAQIALLVGHKDDAAYINQIVAAAGWTV